MSQQRSTPPVDPIVTPNEPADYFWDQASDSELIEIFNRSHSPDAMRAIIARHGPLVHGVVSRLLGQYHDNQEAFQATFLAFFQATRRLRNRHSLGSYLYGIAYRTAKRVRQRKADQLKRFPLQEAIDVENCASEQEECPFERFAKRMQHEALDEELQELPESLRAPIVEHYFAGRSVPDIAHSMSLSVAAIEGRIKRAKKQLRSRLAVRGLSITAILLSLPASTSTAAEATIQAWGNELIENYSLWSNNAPEMASNEATASLQSLVQGELKMRVSTRSSWIAWTGTMCAISAIGLGLLPWSNKDRFTTSSLLAATTSQATDVPPAVLLQGGMGAMPGQQSIQNKTTSEAENGTSERSTKKEPATPPVIWEKPKDLPFWMRNESDAEQLAKEEETRQTLGKRISFQFVNVPLAQVLEVISEELDVDILLDEQALEEESIPADQPINYKRRHEVPASEGLRNILSSLQLVYSIDNSLVRVTSKNRELHKLRFYDASFVCPDNSTIQELTSVIQNTIESDSWQMNGGSAVIDLFGSMLVVRASEESHEAIEVLLKRISAQPQQNIKPRPGVLWPPVGGMGGGMGGMGGGGMGGMGGGLGSGMF